MLAGVLTLTHKYRTYGILMEVLLVEEQHVISIA